MPTIGWIFLLLALGMILGSLFLLRDSANTTRFSEDRLEKIRKRKAELDARDKDGEDW